MFNSAASLTSPYNQGTKQTLPSNRSGDNHISRRGNHTPLPVRRFKAVKTAESFSTLGSTHPRNPLTECFFYELLGRPEPTCAISENLSIILSIIAYHIIFFTDLS